MNFFEIYSLLFTDSLSGDLVFIVGESFALKTMITFNQYNNYLLITLPFIAWIIASLANYAIGISANKILENHERKLSEKQLKRVESQKKIIKKYKNLILVLSVLPIYGKLIIMLAGLWHFGILRTLMISSTMKLIYYTYLVIT